MEMDRRSCQCALRIGELMREQSQLTEPSYNESYDETDVKSFTRTLATVSGACGIALGEEIIKLDALHTSTLPYPGRRLIFKDIIQRSIDTVTTELLKCSKDTGNKYSNRCGVPGDRGYDLEPLQDQIRRAEACVRKSEKILKKIK